ncbi:P-aminobenzoate N-oxygenase AurF [Mycobacteroides abscessus]|nr:P-aminobenzoate N-oxygenase AurF [Mycobacteroides abscessus]
MGVEVTSQRGQVRTRSDADPQRALERRLKASAEKYYDPEIDIDWEAPIDPARPWLSPHRVGLEGTELWESLTREQRLEFGRQQLGSILILGIWFETALAVFLYHDLMVSPVTGGRSRYLLTEIGEETRHSTMFARLVEKMGEDATAVEFRVPRFARGAVPFFSSLVPVGPAMYTAVLMAEEVLDRLQREGMNDPALQPHARAAMRIHVIEEARHVSFAKDEIVRGYRDAGPVGRFLTRVAAGLGADLAAQQASLQAAWHGDTSMSQAAWQAQWNTAMEELIRAYRAMGSTHETNTLSMNARDMAEGAKWGA